MKKFITTIALTITAISASFSQSTHHLEFEIDPLAYSIGGASGHVAYTWKNERAQLGYGQLTLPTSMQNHENVKESFRAISFKWDYFFGRENPDQGFFAGPTLDYLFLKYEDEMNRVTKDQQLALGIRTGYKFDLFKKNKSLNGLYLTPWIGTSWMTNAKDITINEESYSRKAMTIFPTVHLGWRF